MPVNTSREQEKREIKTPWSDPHALPKPKRESVILAYAASLVCSLAIPFVSYSYVSFVVLALLFMYVVYTARIPSVVVFALVTTAIIGMIDIPAATVWLCLGVGTCSAAFLFTVLKRPHYAILPFLLAFIAVFAITRDWQVAVLVLPALPAAALLAVATKRDEGRTGAICWGAGGFAIFIAAILIYLLVSGSAAQGIGVFEYIDLLRNRLAEWMYSFRDTMLEPVNTFRETLASLSGQMGEELVVIDDSVMGLPFFTALAAMIFNLIPAMILMLCSAVAYTAQMLLTAQYRSAGMERVITLASKTFTLSVTSAILYLISFVITIFAAQNSAFVVFANNLCLILLPAFCVFTVNWLRGMKKGSRALPLIMVSILFCCTPNAAIYFFASLGAYQVISDAIHTKLLDRVKELGGKFPPEDDGDD